MLPGACSMSRGRISWRGRLSTLSEKEGARFLRKIGSVLVLDLVALRQGKDFKNFEKEQKYGMAIPKSGNAVQGTASTSRIYSCDRHHRRRQERAVRLCHRYRRTIARAVEAQVNPIEDGTELRNTATLQILKHRCTMHRDL